MAVQQTPSIPRNNKEKGETNSKAEDWNRHAIKERTAGKQGGTQGPFFVAACLVQPC
jgi:hypothetical protein